MAVVTALKVGDNGIPARFSAADTMAPRVTLGSTSGTAPTPNIDNEDLFILSGLSVNVVFGAPTGTPSHGMRLMIRIKDNGTARTIGWNSGTNGYRAVGMILPTTTVSSKTIYVGCVYNSTDSKWDVIAVVSEQ